jgi:hypothetical protein
MVCTVPCSATLLLDFAPNINDAVACAFPEFNADGPRFVSRGPVTKGWITKDQEAAGLAVLAQSQET